MTDKLVVAVTDKLCFTEIGFRFYPKVINWQGTFGTASGSAPSRTKARGRKPPCELFAYARQRAGRCGGWERAPAATDH